MAAPILLLDTPVEMQSTLGTPKTITGITLANPAVVTSTGHGIANGALVVLSLAGMVQLNNAVCRVANQATDTFELEGIDSSGYTAFTSGTATEVTALVSYSNITGISFPEPQPTRLDYTTVDGGIKKEIFGLDDAALVTLNMIADPTNATIVALRAAAAAKTTRAFRITLKDGTVLIMNAYVAGGRGLDGQVGAIATAQANLTLAAKEQYL